MGGVLGGRRAWDMLALAVNADGEIGAWGTRRSAAITDALVCGMRGFVARTGAGAVIQPQTDVRGTAEHTQTDWA